MDIIVHELVFFKDFSYFTKYFNTRRAIHSQNNKDKLQSVYTLCLVTLIEITYNLYLIFRPTLSPSSAMMHFAVFHYINLPSLLYLLPAVAETLSLYYLYLLYLNKSEGKAVLEFYDHIVVVRKERTVLWLT